VFTATVPPDGGALPDLVGPDLVGPDLMGADLMEAELGILPCRSHDPDLWFAELPAALERAKQLCSGCPIKAACLEGALARQEPWGVWGGEIFEHGVVIRRKRSRGRPSKAARERDRAERERAQRETAA
jgi:WhiB family transcriptional regulator, redox-sensing transcriptional regulator